MNKTAIKNYAIWARNTLIEAVGQRAFQYGVTEKDCGDPMADSVNGFVLTTAEKKQRQALIAKIREKGYEQVMEEAAYTWFNRFIALRFMEVNGYLPTRVRVFTDEENAFKPQILSEATHLELEGLKLDRVIALKEANKTEELFKYLLITQCNALSAVLPGMFQKIEDYTELLLPDNLLRDGSVIEQLVTTIPEEDWTDQVQIIGWLYQYYNTEPKDKVFADLKKNIKISKEKIPAATQLFTPDWIVRYMVENSLGRLWVEGHPNDELKANWRYYLEEAEQEPEVQAQLAEIRKGYAALNPEDLRVIDPCCGSGHILCYLFDVLMQIYEASGYTARDAAQSILIHNLWGLDIDERAAQLSYFAVMMKARQYDRRFFSRNIQPHVYAIAESNNVSREAMEYFCKDDAALIKAMRTILTELHDAKEYGSILTCSRQDWDTLYARFNEIYDDIALHREEALALLPLVQTAEALSQQYDVVVTNPPYMGSSGMSAKLGDYVKKNYPDSKSDLFAVFIERCGQMAKQSGYQAMITQHAWMFLGSYEKLRAKLLARDTVNMTHLGARAFEEIGGEVVQTTSFVLRNIHTKNYKGTYCRLIDPTTQSGKEEMFLSGENRYHAAQSNFSKIPGAPIAYWVSESFYRCFEDRRPLDDNYSLREGIHTADNERFLRLWTEINRNQIVFTATCYEDIDNQGKWVPYNKGGQFRKWYGNNDYVICFDYASRQAMETYQGHVRPSQSLYFKEGGTWTAVSGGRFGIRYYPQGFLFDAGGQVAVGHDIIPCIAYLNSSVFSRIAEITMPTINFKCGVIKTLPDLCIKNDDVEKLTQANIENSKNDWDSFETSWDFQRHPLAVSSIPAVFGAEYCGKYVTRLEDHYYAWKNECKERFENLQINEEELNRIFIDIYGLQDELTPDVADKDVTVHRVFDNKDDVPESMKGSNYVRTMRDEIVSLISYAVGCMFGRYSLDVDGLAYAGGEWDASKYKTIIPDSDNIIPICDDDYFDDDITGRFVKWVDAVYGKDTLEENLKFIADALGGKGTPRDVIRNYFLNDFYADHLKIYQKRPIYWLFDSGKKNGFKCLIYMHRYQPDTIARIRTDYVHEQQSRYRTAIADLEQRVEIAAPAERVKLSKQLQKLRDQATEVQKYEEKIHHLADQMIKIDLDDGVKVNYAKFEDVLAKIK